MDFIFKIILISIVIGIFVSVFCWTFDIADYFVNPNFNDSRTLTMRFERTFDNMRKGLPIAQFRGYVDSYHLMTVFDIGADVLSIFDIDVSSVTDTYETVIDGLKDFFSQFTWFVKLPIFNKVV